MKLWSFFFTAVVLALLCVDVSTQSIEGITFISIPGGTFQMGDEKGDLWKDCRPVHTVTLSSFEMSETEITNAQYCEYLNAALKAGGITADSSSVYIAKGSHYWEKYLLLSKSAYLYNRCWITYSNNVFRSCN